MAGSGKFHVRGPRLKAGVAHAAILRGKYHNHAWPTQKMPRVCEVISGLYCRLYCNSTVVWLYADGVSLILPDVRFGTVSLD